METKFNKIAQKIGWTTNSGNLKVRRYTHEFENEKWEELSIRNFDLFTPDYSEEDDDHPIFSRKNEVEEIVAQFKFEGSTKITVSDSEKSWFSLTVVYPK